MNYLEELAVKYGTDKQIANGHGYTYLYNVLFHGFRLDEFNFLELGVREGWSMNMWMDYFPNAILYGIDNDKEGLCPKQFNSRINFFKFNQDDPYMLQFLPSNLRIIIDDCSHISHLSINSFNLLFPLVSSGGYYIIEDANTCRFPAYCPEGVPVIDYFNNLNHPEIENTVITDKLIIIKKA